MWLVEKYESEYGEITILGMWVTDSEETAKAKVVEVEESSYENEYAFYRWVDKI